MGVRVEDWGEIAFREAWVRQTEIQESLKQDRALDSVLVMCEHPTVITKGRNTHDENILEAIIASSGKDIDIVNINRGGDVTMHNPGQLVGYPIFNLNNYKQDLHWFLRGIEQCIINVMHHIGIECGRVEGRTGVWVDGERKVCAIGIHCSRWVTAHGFALNVTNDLSEFNYIVPCGISDAAVTSVQEELNTEVTVAKIKSLIAAEFREYFQMFENMLDS